MTILNQVKQWVKLRSLYSSIRACPHFEHDDKNEINCSQTVLNSCVKNEMFTGSNDSLK